MRLRRFKLMGLLLAAVFAALLGAGGLVAVHGQGVPAAATPAYQAPIDVGLDVGQAALLARLDDKVTAEFAETPLQEALSILGGKARVRFVLDADALAQAKVPPDAPVNGNFRQAPLGRILDRITKTIGFGYCFNEDSILVTDKISAAEQVWTRVYPVADLAAVPTEKRIRFLGEELVQVIQETLEPQSWDDFDGPGFITFETLSFSLVVTQSLSAHRAIESYLQGLRQSRGRLEHYCEATHAPVPKKLWTAYFAPDLELRRMYETMTALEQGGNPGIVGWSASEASKPFLPAAARRLAARALAFAADVEDEIDGASEEQDPKRHPILVHSSKKPTQTSLTASTTSTKSERGKNRSSARKPASSRGTLIACPSPEKGSAP